jgi:hypothetical protein
VSYAPPPSPPPPPSAPRQRPWWRATWVLLTAVAVVALIVGTSAGASSGKTKTVTKTVAGPTVSVTVPVVHTVTETARPTVIKTIATRTAVVTHTYTPPPPKQYGEGTYVVGTDIQPGVYRTSGSGDCYWARLSSLNTTDIIDNSASSGPQTVQVQGGDKAFEVTGSCTFGRIG